MKSWYMLNEVLMNLKNIMFSERNSHKRPHVVGVHRYEIESRIGNSIETESRYEVAQC